MTMGTMNAMATIINNNRNFYASDYGFNGGIISALARRGIIEKTGNTKIVIVEIGYKAYKRNEVYEWCVSRKGVNAIADMIRGELNTMIVLANVAENF